MGLFADNYVIENWDLECKMNKSIQMGGKERKRKEVFVKKKDKRYAVIGWTWEEWLSVNNTF